ncbi:hypothetical protein [Pelagibacterium halotolerans]|uniref:hypothetical protein n=1 Tax=Pelagibacterium halotolerans TaxID=531813 RepID=UPI00384AF2E8
MTKKPYSKVGDTYYPNYHEQYVSGKEVKGRAWAENKKFYYEYDAGHFATKIRTVEISREDFEALKEGRLSDKDLTLKYG